jgi:NTP pyrophosphatase (non-canonical NTP hydrolase)
MSRVEIEIVVSEAIRNHLEKYHSKSKPAAAKGVSERPLGRDVVRWFARQMERVLRRNDLKGGWDTSDSETVGYLLGRLNEEVAELVEAIADDKHYPAVRDEAVDVANIAMMIADCITPGTRKQARGS